jgi:hypothetical protein
MECLFPGVVVAYRGAFLHAARRRDGAGLGQQGLAEGGLAGGGMAYQSDVAELIDGVVGHLLLLWDK